MDHAHQREVWLPQDLTRTGLIRENGKDITQHPAPGQPGIYNPTYQWLASLPTDPAALLKNIYADTKGHGIGPDDEAFNMIGELLRESIIPPKVNAALYRAAARIPGVVVIPTRWTQPGGTAWASPARTPPVSATSGSSTRRA